jgi:hypothetical protein
LLVVAQLFLFTTLPVSSADWDGKRFHGGNYGGRNGFEDLDDPMSSQRVPVIQFQTTSPPLIQLTDEIEVEEEEAGALIGR